MEQNKKHRLSTNYLYKRGREYLEFDKAYTIDDLPVLKEMHTKAHEMPYAGYFGFLLRHFGINESRSLAGFPELNDVSYWTGAEFQTREGSVALLFPLLEKAYGNSASETENKGIIFTSPRVKGSKPQPYGPIVLAKGNLSLKSVERKINEVYEVLKRKEEYERDTKDAREKAKKYVHFEFG